MERRFLVRKQEMLAECEVSSRVFTGIVERLGKFVEPFAAAVRDVSAESLATIGSPAVAPLSRLVRDRDRDPGVRWRAASALGRMGASAK